MGLNLCISSINKTSLSCRLVNKPAKSAGLSKTGPEVTLISTSNSFAKIFASVVFLILVDHGIMYDLKLHFFDLQPQQKFLNY